MHTNKTIEYLPVYSYIAEVWMHSQFLLAPDKFVERKITKAEYDKELAEHNQELDAIKSKMDLPGIKFYSFDPFAKHKWKYKDQYNIPYITNAWLKFYEMVFRYRMFDSIPDGAEVITFDNTAFPGASILSTEHYIKTVCKSRFSHKWYASSLYEPADLKEDQPFKLNILDPKDDIANPEHKEKYDGKRQLMETMLKRLHLLDSGVLRGSDRAIGDATPVHMGVERNKFLEHHLSDTKINKIIDCTGGIGLDAMEMSLLGFIKEIVVYEMTDRYADLVENVKQNKKIKCINDNCMVMIQPEFKHVKPENTLICIDVPYGGESYKSTAFDELYMYEMHLDKLRGYPLRKLCRTLLDLKYPFICLKVPVEYPKEKLIRYFDMIGEHDMKNKAGEVKSKTYLIAKKVNTDMLYDKYGLYANDKSNWLMDEEYNGDVTSLRVLEHLEKVQKPKFFNKGVYLYKSDLGFDVSQDYNNQESITAKGNLGQILYGLLILAEGGWMITKQFTMLTDFTLTMMYLLTQSFDKLYVIKPMTSKLSNGETYLLGKGYKRNESVINAFKQKLKNFECTAFDVDLPEWYLAKMFACNKFFIKSQIQMVDKGFGSIFKNDKDYQLIIKKFELEVPITRAD